MMGVNHTYDRAVLFCAKQTLQLCSNAQYRGGRKRWLVLCLQEQETWQSTTNGHLSEIAKTLGFTQERVVGMVLSGAGLILNKGTVNLVGV